MPPDMPPNTMQPHLDENGIDDSHLEEFEHVAIEAASKAGSFVLERITSIAEIESKPGVRGVTW